MSVYYDPERQAWRYDFQRDKRRHAGYCLRPDGTKCETKSEAEDAEAVKRAAVIQAPRQAALAPRGGANYSLIQAVMAYSAQATSYSSWDNIEDYLREILGWFGPATPLTEITR